LNLVIIVLLLMIAERVGVPEIRWLWLSLGAAMIGSWLFG